MNESTGIEYEYTTRDFNDNHVHEKTDIEFDEMKETSRHRPVQLVVPEPRRITPVHTMEDNSSSLKSAHDIGVKASHLVPGLLSPYQHPLLPWQLPYFTGVPGYPYLRHPGLQAYALSMLPDHLPWRYFPMEPKEHLYSRLPLFHGMQEHSKRVDSPSEPIKIEEKRADDNKQMYRNYATDTDDVRKAPPVFLGTGTEPITPDKKKKKETEQLKYVCSTCNKSYSTFSGLSKHKQFHCDQDGKKEFSCKYCDKTYVSLGALKMHIRTHTLPCKCKICGKAFSRPWLLQGHVRTHTGEKPFTCVHCLRAFADRSNLRAHLQTHSDVKKYSCKSCSKTFSRMSLLLKHEDVCSRPDNI